jgi:hypothetical protein
MKTKKTLSLRKETLATLSKDALADVAGAAGTTGNLPTINLGCVSRAVCPPSLPLCIPSVKGSCQACV